MGLGDEITVCRLPFLMTLGKIWEELQTSSLRSSKWSLPCHIPMWILQMTVFRQPPIARQFYSCSVINVASICPQRVNWSLIWFEGRINKHSFFAWRALWDGLKTKPSAPRLGLSSFYFFLGLTPPSLPAQKRLKVMSLQRSFLLEHLKKGEKCRIFT